MQLIVWKWHSLVIMFSAGLVQRSGTMQSVSYPVGARPQEAHSGYQLIRAPTQPLQQGNMDRLGSCRSYLVKTNPRAVLSNYLFVLYITMIIILVSYVHTQEWMEKLYTYVQMMKPIICTTWMCVAHNICGYRRPQIFTRFGASYTSNKANHFQKIHISTTSHKTIAEFVKIGGLIKTIVHCYIGKILPVSCPYPTSCMPNSRQLLCNCTTTNISSRWIRLAHVNKIEVQFSFYLSFEFCWQNTELLNLNFFPFSFFSSSGRHGFQQSAQLPQYAPPQQPQTPSIQPVIESGG